MNFIKYLWRNHKVTFFLLAAMFLLPFCLMTSISWKLGIGFIFLCGLAGLVCKFLYFVSDCYDDYKCERWNKGSFWKM